MNRNLVLAAVVTGILCGVWAGVAPLVNLSIWAGFAGTTAYFASGKSGAKGLFLTVATTFVGVGQPETDLADLANRWCRR